jgi:deferrochelatase/peroxidase EfeB
VQGDGSDKVDRILRRAVAFGLGVAGVLGLFVVAIVFLFVQNSGSPFRQNQLSYWLVLAPGGLALSCLIGAGFVWPWHRISN